MPSTPNQEDLCPADKPVYNADYACCHAVDAECGEAEPARIELCGKQVIALPAGCPLIATNQRGARHYAVRKRFCGVVWIATKRGCSIELKKN